MLIVEGPSDGPLTGFADVPADAYYEAAVAWAVAQGVTQGTGNNLFSPDSPCTRAQVVTFLWRASGSQEPASTSGPFRDVQDPEAYYYKAVLWAVENEITSGTTLNTFSPEDPCTRAQVVTFLWRTKGKPVSSGASSFVDVPHGQYYSDAVTWAVENGITSGTGNNRFSPDDTCTRAQIVTFLYRAS